MGTPIENSPKQLLGYDRYALGRHTGRRLKPSPRSVNYHLTLTNYKN